MRLEEINPDTCKWCGKPLLNPRRNQRFHTECIRKQINKQGRDKYRLINNCKNFRVDEEGNRVFNKWITTEKQLKFLKKHNETNFGINHGKWKGDNVKYTALHQWVRRYKPFRDSCEFCGKSNCMIHLANISGEYKRDIDDFKWLCASCHFKMDRRGNNKGKGKLKIGRTESKEVIKSRNRAYHLKKKLERLKNG